MRNEIYLLLGSNLEDRERNLLLAIKKINEQAGTVCVVSSLYITQPWGVSDQPEFLNQVIEIESSFSPQQLLRCLQTIEQEIGRKKTTHWGPRTIDIDILFDGKKVITEKDLIIPHPGISERRFALVPMCEIAPNFIHPGLLISCKQILKACTDPLRVSVYAPTDS